MIDIGHKHKLQLLHQQSLVTAHISKSVNKHWLFVVTKMPVRDTTVKGIPQKNRDVVLNKCFPVTIAVGSWVLISNQTMIKKICRNWPMGRLAWKFQQIVVITTLFTKVLTTLDYCWHSNHSGWCICQRVAQSFLYSRSPLSHSLVSSSSLSF